MTNWAALLPLGHAPHAMQPRRVRALELMARHNQLAVVGAALGVSGERCRQILRMALRDFVRHVDLDTLLDSRRDEARVKMALRATRRRLWWQGWRRAGLRDTLAAGRENPDYGADPVQDLIGWLKREARRRAGVAEQSSATEPSRIP